MIQVISKRPISATAQVIKPTTVRTAIVSTMITVEAVLDQPGLQIVEGNCAINDEGIVAAYDLGRGLYTLEYEVKEGKYIIKKRKREQRVHSRIYKKQPVDFQFSIPPPPFLQTCFNSFITYLLLFQNTPKKLFFLML